MDCTCVNIAMRQMKAYQACCIVDVEKDKRKKSGVSDEGGRKVEPQSQSKEIWRCRRSA